MCMRKESRALNSHRRVASARPTRLLVYTRLPGAQVPAEKKVPPMTGLPKAAEVWTWVLNLTG